MQRSIELVKSKETGIFYATAKKASIPSTFDEKTAQIFIDQQIDRTVQKVKCEPYEIVDGETGEIRTMDFRWVHVKEGETVSQTIRQFE